jgi:hypothetical protein
MGNAADSLLLWLTRKMAEKPWITYGAGFGGGMLVGFLIWAIGVR